jgi:hypothetical protein
VLKFKERERTDYVMVVLGDCHNKDMTELRREAKCRGDFEVGWHYLVRRDGSIEKGRIDTAPAGHTLPGCNTSVYILVDTDPDEGVTDAQDDAYYFIRGIWPEASMKLVDLEDLNVTV